jgi:hypothetical protein
MMMMMSAADMTVSLSPSDRSISDLSAITVVTTFDIQGRKGEVLFFSFLPK